MSQKDWKNYSHQQNFMEDDVFFCTDFVYLRCIEKLLSLFYFIEDFMI